MQDKYKDYMDLLKAFVSGNPYKIDLTLNWNELLQKAQINNTLGIVGYMIMSDKTLSEPNLKGFGRNACMNEIMTFAHRAGAMEGLIKLLNENHIAHLLFKGFIVRNFYPVPELRTFGDIDFVIRKEDRQKCHELMLANGYTPGYDWEPVYDYKKGAEYYEIHTDVMEIDVSEKYDYREYYSHIWEYVFRPDEVNKPYTYEFKPEFHLLYLMTHIAKHINSSGAGIRMYMDIAFYIQHYGNNVDWNWIQQEVKKLHFEDFFNITFTAIEQWFGIISPIPLNPIDQQVMDDFLEFTLEGGTFGKVGRDRETIHLKNNDKGNDEDVSKIKTLLFHIFPPVSSLENRYEFLQKHHWMLPIAWIRRIIDNRDSWGRYKKEAKGIINADTEEVKKLKRMYKEIGL